MSVTKIPAITTIASLLDALDARGSSPQERAAFDEAVWKSCGTEAAILVTDLSGFTRLTKKHGILHFLAVFQRCRLVCEPIIERHGGVVLKKEADDLIVLFERGSDGLAAAVEMLRATDALNATLSEDDRVHLCMGIEWGPLLRLEDDAFGDAVNVAFKLGEDIAAPEEILVGPSLYEAVIERGDFPLDGCVLSDRRVVESGNVPLEHYAIRIDEGR